MKKVVKVSISGVSFTVEEDAQQILSQYLDELKDHYASAQGKDDIIGDIEERIAELLIERGGKDKTISVNDINYIISTLGRPADIDGTPDNDGKSDEIPQKRIYRDTDHKLLGGVCAGLAAYLHWDVVLVRLLYLAASFVLVFPFRWITHIFNFSVVGFSILIYLLLWIIIPAAKTVSQKCAMRGKAMDVNEIQKKFIERTENFSSDGGKHAGKYSGNYENHPSRFLKIAGRIISILVGIVLICTGMGGVIGGVLMAFGLHVLRGLSMINLIDYIQLGSTHIIWLKILGTLVWLLPFLGFTYIGILMCFDLHSPKWKPGLVNFLIWIVALLAFIGMGVKTADRYFYPNEQYSSADIPQKDTLYLKIEGLPQIYRSSCFDNICNRNVYLKTVRKNGEDNLQFYVYPAIRTYRDSIGEFKMDIKNTYYDQYGEADLKLNMSNIYSIKDSLITIYPTKYSKLEKYDGQFTRILLHLSKSTVVIPLYSDSQKKYYRDIYSDYYNPFDY